VLNFIYYPVSAILWFWHKVFGSVLGASSGIAWALSVTFLVFTLRILLFKPFVKQVRTQRQMQEFQPQIKALQKKYAGDRQKLATEMQKLQKENGFNPIAGCLPVLAQGPVFIGLFHVLRSFNRTGTGVGQLGLSPAENASYPNYVFSAEDVRSFLDAKLFGAPLAAQITSTVDQLAAYTGGVGRLDIALVAIPLMVIAAIATHFTARASVARQPVPAEANPQAAIMNKLVLWVFPFFVLVGGPFLPVAILLYWLSNNAWTLVQQHYVFAGIAREDEAKKLEAHERRSASAPKPGARPQNTKGRKPKDVDRTTDDGAPEHLNGINPGVEPGTADRPADGDEPPGSPEAETGPAPRADLSKGSASAAPKKGRNSAPGTRHGATRATASGAGKPSSRPTRRSPKKR